MSDRHISHLFDLSFGQRLAAGFGMLLLLMGVLALVAAISNQRSAEAMRTFNSEAAPMARAADMLERSVLRTSAALQSYYLVADSERWQRFIDAAAQTRSATAELGRFPLDVDSQALHRRLQVDVENYLRQADALAGRVRSGQAGIADEWEMSVLSADLLTAVRIMNQTQSERVAQSLEKLRAAQQAVSDALLWGGLLALVVFIGFAVLAVQSVRKPARALLQVAQALAMGDRQPALALLDKVNTSRTPRRNEILQLAGAFASAADAIERRERRFGTDRQVAMAAASGFDRTRVAGDALAAIARGMHAEVGVIYCWDEATSLLRPVANYGVPPDLPALTMGEGLPGLCAQRREQVVFDDLPADGPYTVKLGFEQLPPKMAVAVPLLFQGRLHGVMVLAALEPLDREAPLFLEATALQLSTGLENVAAYERVQQLLGEVRERNERIQSQNAELTRHQQTLEEQNQKLQVQSDVLAEGDRRKNDFIALLAHELRNPMAPITASLEMLQRSEPGGPQARHALVVIDRQVQQMQRLIDDLLDLTRITRGKILLRSERIDLVETIRRSVEDYTRPIREKRLALELDLPSIPVPVDGDSVRLCQVIGNLLNNAIKFTGVDGRISLSLSVDHALPAEAVLRIADDGIGMPAELIGRLFQPFSQGVMNLDRGPGGLGLGLALVKSLIEMHGGQVSATSAGRGSGSCFEVRLPLAAPMPASRRNDKPRLPDPVVTRPRRILVIDDNKDAANMLSSVLALDGHEVRVVYSGMDGLIEARSFHPDLVLCDIGLPGLDGYQVAGRFRADPGLSGIHLVALTGYAMPEDKQRAKAAGFDRHEAKPLTRERLRDVLNTLGRNVVAS